jgi:uncharacterized membrane protein YfhO
VIEGGAAGSGHDGAVRIVDYGATRLRLSVEMNGPGLVVLTDTFYPGWEARVDGQAAAIHRVDGLFRGVFVEGGRHEITMRFRPSSQSWGLALSAAGLAAVVALIVVPARERPSPDVVPLPFPARE